MAEKTNWQYLKSDGFYLRVPAPLKYNFPELEVWDGERWTTTTSEERAKTMAFSRVIAKSELPDYVKP